MCRYLIKAAPSAGGSTIENYSKAVISYFIEKDKAAMGEKSIDIKFFICYHL